MNQLIKTIFADKHGKLRVFEVPNLPFIVGFTAWFFTMVLPYGTWNFIAALVSFGAFFTWAWLELFDGNSLFRRALGCAVMILLIANKIA